jgi:NitT/TauT family transport system ATP-binding protein
MPTKAMLVVSHNIEEAVLMADRVLVFASDPGRVRCQLSVQLDRPRDPESEQVRVLVDEIYALMTAGAIRAGRPAGERAVLPLAARLPEADIARIEGLLELLADERFGGRADLPRVAEETELTDEDLLPLAEAVSLLDFAKLVAGDLHLTALGRQYVEGAHAARQEIFGRQLLAHVPLAAHIRHSLEQEASGELPEEPFMALLRQSLDPEEAERVLRTAIEWGRHGEVFEYDYHTGLIHLPTGDALPPAGEVR